MRAVAQRTVRHSCGRPDHHPGLGVECDDVHIAPPGVDFVEVPPVLRESHAAGPPHVRLDEPRVATRLAVRNREQPRTRCAGAITAEENVVAVGCPAHEVVVRRVLHQRVFLAGCHVHNVDVAVLGIVRVVVSDVTSVGRKAHAAGGGGIIEGPEEPSAAIAR